MTAPQAGGGLASVEMGAWLQAALADRPVPSGMDVDWPCARSPMSVGKRFLTWYADHVPYLRSRQDLVRLCYLTVTKFLMLPRPGNGASHKRVRASRLPAPQDQSANPDGTLMAWQNDVRPHSSRWPSVQACR
jgi:hypothetical protein